MSGKIPFERGNSVYWGFLAEKNKHFDRCKRSNQLPCILRQTLWGYPYFGREARAMLQIYNSLTRKKEPFQTLEANLVRMYVCGMTVYDYCHLGHARMLVSFDMIQRWLRAQGYDVQYVRNITDIDDKIIQRALDTQQSLTAVTDFYIQAMHEDEAALNVERPTHEPRATQYIPQMVEIIEELVRKNLAYPAANGDVNFAVRSFAEYGKLSGQDLDAMQAGQRVQSDPHKRDPLDFVLWKSAKEHEPADTRWQSPYGWGRPGWHIECSAMSRSLLGMPLDIHGGGPDLKFPHHENEIAQSEGAYEQPLANWWMHCGSLMVDSEKMSKSLGNFFTIRDILKEYPAEVVRYFILKSHYRSAQNFSKDNLQESKAALTRLYNALQHVQAVPVTIDWSVEPCATFARAMNDDFNTPEAFAVLFDLAAQVNKNHCSETAGLLLALGGILGLLQQNPQNFLQGGEDASIDRLIEQRLQAKKDKDFALSDKIRNDLLAQGIILEDLPGGKTIWRRQ